MALLSDEVPVSPPHPLTSDAPVPSAPQMMVSGHSPSYLRVVVSGQEANVPSPRKGCCKKAPQLLIQPFALVSLWIQLRIYSDTLLNGTLMFTTQAGFIHG